MRTIFPLLLIYLFLTNHLRANDKNAFSLLEDSPPLALENDGQHYENPITKSDNKVITWLKETNFKLDLGLTDTKLSNGLSLTLKEFYNSRPLNSYNNLYIRLDRLKLGFALSPGDWISTLPVFVNIKPQSSIFCIRHYSDYQKALLDKPFNLKNLPLKARLARKMKEGDVITFPVELNLMFGGQGYLPLFNFTQISFQGKLLISSQFRIEIIKIKNDKVRLRLIVQNEKGIEGKASFGPNFTLLAIPMAPQIIHTAGDPLLTTFLGSEGPAKLDSLFLSDITLKFIEGQAGHSKGDIFVADYIYNLSFREAREAYNQIFTGIKKFKDFAIKLTSFKKRPIKNQLISKLDLTEELALKDEDSENPRVMRIIRGTNAYQKKSGKFTASILLAQTSIGNTNTKNLITYHDDDNSYHKYLFPITTWKMDSHALFFSKSSIINNNFALLPINQHEKIKGIELFGLSFFRGESHLRKRELKKFKKYFRYNMTPNLYQQIKWPRYWNFDTFRKNTTRKKTRIFFQVILNKLAYQYLSNIPENQRKILAISYLKSINQQFKHEIGIRIMLNRLRPILSPPGSRWTKVNASQYFRGIRKGMLITDNHRANELMRLRYSLTYQLVGLGALISMLPKESIEDYLYIKLELQDEKFDNNFLYELTDQDNQELFSTLLEIQLLTNFKNLLKLPSKTNDWNFGRYQEEEELQNYPYFK